MIQLLPEWHQQNGLLLTWPHLKSDWKKSLNHIQSFYIKFISELLKHEYVFVLCLDQNECDDIQEKLSLYTAQTSKLLSNKLLSNLEFIFIRSNDTWIRDYGPLRVKNDNQLEYHNFQFNAWGNKYPYEHDNAASSKLSQHSLLKKYPWRSHDLILEAGAIETNGENVLLCQKQCVLHPNRNNLNQNQFEKYMQNHLGIKSFLWLEDLVLEGDDTDGHIDNFARFCSSNIIAYLHCDDPNNSHFHNLKSLHSQLSSVTQKKNQHYQLIPIPISDEVLDNSSNILPASYLNFLIANSCVLVPQFGVRQDIEALEVIKKLFPEKKCIGLNCTELLTQGGGLHCASLQI